MRCHTFDNRHSCQGFSFSASLKNMIISFGIIEDISPGVTLLKRDSLLVTLLSSKLSFLYFLHCICSSTLSYTHFLTDVTRRTSTADFF